MKTKTTNSGLKVKANVKAGGMHTINHNSLGLHVRTAVKAGGMPLRPNHSSSQQKTKTSSGLKVKANVKAGGMHTINHNSLGLHVRTAVKAGGMPLRPNHSSSQQAIG